jgi:DNA-binding CsgD family transcriptional regulator
MELKVLNLLIKGFTAGKIGDELGIARTTVITHIRKMKKKLTTRNINNLVYKAVKAGLV